MSAHLNADMDRNVQINQTGNPCLITIIQKTYMDPYLVDWCNGIRCAARGDEVVTLL